MTSGEWLTAATNRLGTVGIDSARLDCLLLLEDQLGQDRSRLLAHPETPITPDQLHTLQSAILRRLRHEPLAYIRSVCEFYGRQFIVDQSVLVPRPESEHIITLLLRLELPAAPLLYDVGTGSGALAVTAKLELPEAAVIATDVDADSLQIAGSNAARHAASITCLQADILRPLDPAGALPGLPDIVMANLPYVPAAYPLNQAARHEPARAIYGGPDGLMYYRRLFAQLRGSAAHVLTESLPEQQADLAELAARFGFTLRQTSGLVQHYAGAQTPPV